MVPFVEHSFIFSGGVLSGSCGTSHLVLGSVFWSNRNGVLQLECTQTKVVIVSSLKKCKGLLTFCWRRLQPGNQWQVSFLELAYAATAAFVWNSSRDEFLSAVSVCVLPRKTKAIIRNVAYQKWAAISWGTTKNQQAEDNGIVWFLMVPQRKRL